jgi:TonB-linked SusC/RagA family outer membrane protein
MYKFYITKPVRPPGCARKFLLVMKLTTLMLLIAIMQVSATTLAQKVTLADKNVPLAKVFEQIASQTGYDFVVTGSILKQAKPITLQVSNEDLQDVLKKVFEGQPFDYQITDRSVLVKLKEASFFDNLKKNVKEYIAAIEVTGRVLDENNQPLASATVTVKGTSNSTLTDANGIFTLKNVQPNETLVVSFIGYEKKEILAITNLGAVRLTPATSALDEVKVQAYGVTSQRITTGNISSVSAKEIEEQPVSNPLLTLQGRAPGVFITQSSGLPGSGVTIRVQGQNSLARGNDPLIVIDGVPYTSQLLPTINAILGTSGGYGSVGSGSPLSFVNPDDIESISLLKDADATSIYGSRAGNGAILITTKKGKTGATKVDFNLQTGWGQVAHFLPVLSTPEYLQMRHEALKNDGLNPYPSISTIPTDRNFDLNGQWDTTRNINWQKQLIGNTAKYSDYNVTISGGSSSTQFLVGGTFHRETTVFPGNLGDDKGGLHFSLTNSSANQKFRFQLTGNYIADNNQLNNVDLTRASINIAPDAPPLYKSDGTLNWASLPNGNSTFFNPLTYLSNTYSNKTNNLFSNAIISYQILPALELKANIGYTNLTSDEISIIPSTNFLPESRAFVQPSSIFANSRLSSWIVEPQINYKARIFKGGLNALLGMTIQQNTSYLEQLAGSNYSTDAQLMDIQSAPTVTVNNTVNTIYKYNAGFGRINYNWDDRYIFDLTGRRDGSSRFGPESQFHSFWSVAGAWIFSNEALFKNNFNILSYGKLRASYGTTGNDQIGDYAFLNLYNNVNGAVPYQGVNGLRPAGIYNPFLQWEETRKMQFGIDLGFFKDRILLSVGYDRNRSSNELLGYALPIITGFGNITANFPATIQNSDWEFTLRTNNVKGREFSWTTNFNLTVPQNKLLNFPNISTSSYSNTFVVGQPFTIVKTYHYLGVDPKTGLYQFSNWNGGATNRPDTASTKNQKTIINRSPKFYGGFQNSFHYKAFELDVFLQFTKQVGPNYMFGNTPGRFFGTSNIGNQPIYVLQRWQRPGNVSPIEKFSSTYSGNQLFGYFDISSSDAYYTDASYVRLKNASISWELPSKWQKAARLQNAKIYFQGQNLFTITNYKGMDPETMSSVSLPPLRIWTIGMRVTL